MADRKRRRMTDDDVAALRRILHTGGVSLAGLADLLKSIREADIEGSPGLHAVRDANLREFQELRVAIDMPMEGGGSFHWELLDPNKLLARAVEQSPMLAALYADAMERCPPSPERPWHLVVGFDEFEPGIRRKRCRMDTMKLQLG